MMRVGDDVWRRGESTLYSPYTPLHLYPYTPRIRLQGEFEDEEDNDLLLYQQQEEDEGEEGEGYVDEGEDEEELTLEELFSMDEDDEEV